VPERLIISEDNHVLLAGLFRRHILTSPVPLSQDKSDNVIKQLVEQAICRGGLSYRRPHKMTHILDPIF
jgi:hypothetical protein